MNLIDTLDQKWPKNMKPKTFHIFVKLESDISDNTKNIIKNWPTTSYHLLFNPKDQILQLTQRTLNLIIQTVNSTIAKALDYKLRLDR